MGKSVVMGVAMDLVREQGGAWRKTCSTDFSILQQQVTCELTTSCILCGIELVDVRVCDVSVPHCGSEALVIALGVRKRTKAKRVQHVVLDPVRHLESYLLVKLLVCTSDPSGLLFPFTYWVFHSSIRAMDARFKLDLGLSGHSGRACFATYCAKTFSS